jgi:TolB-like protein
MSNSQNQPSGFSRFVAELRRRHVVRFAIAYAAAAFVLLQLAEIVFPAFGFGEVHLRILVIGVTLLFPPAVVLAWVFDITAEGIKRTQELPGGRQPGRLTPRLALLVVTFAVVGSLAVWVVQVGVFEETMTGSSSTDPAITLAAYDPADPIESLAVLPLQNLSGSGEQDYFTAGMHEELIAQLSQIAGLRVVSRTSVARFAGASLSAPAIGQELQVDAIIEGSVRRQADTVRITVQLIHAASDSHVWTKQYDRTLENVLALQAEVAYDIAQQVQAEMSQEEQSLLTRTATRDVDPEAQDAYLRGRYEVQKGTPEAYEAAWQYFEEAVSEDSTFAPALAGLAGTRFLLGMAEGNPEAEEVELAIQDAERALRLDSTSIEAQDVLGAIQRSLPEISRITAGNLRPPPAPHTRVIHLPGTTDSVVLRFDTSYVAAMTELGRQLEERVMVVGARRDEASVAMVAGARPLMAMGQFAEAAEVLEEAVREAPHSSAAWQGLLQARVGAADADGVAETVARWHESGAPDAPSAEDAAEVRAAVRTSGMPGYWTWLKEDHERRLAEGEGVSLTRLAAAYCALGDTERALELLVQGLREGDRALGSLQSDPVWDPLRKDPRFVSILRQMRTVRVGPKRLR